MVRAVGGASITALILPGIMNGVPTRLDHVTVVAVDFAAALAFYDAALAPLGWSRAVEFGDEEEEDAPVEAAGWGPPDSAAVLWLVAGPVATTGAHLCLRAPSRESVEAFYSAALGAGGTGHDAPRRWPIYRRGEFSAVVIDPAGNAVEAVSAE